MGRRIQPWLNSETNEPVGQGLSMRLPCLGRGCEWAVAILRPTASTSILGMLKAAANDCPCPPVFDFDVGRTAQYSLHARCSEMPASGPTCTLTRADRTAGSRHSTHTRLAACLVQIRHPVCPPRHPGRLCARTLWQSHLSPWRQACRPGLCTA